MVETVKEKALNEYVIVMILHEDNDEIVDVLESDKTRPSKGIVYSIGNKVDLPIKCGDTVRFNENVGKRLDGNSDLLVISCYSIYSVIKEG